MIVWTDVETTGLSERTGHLLEVALVITDDQLIEIGHMSIVVRPVGWDINTTLFEPGVREMHERSGLIAELEAGAGWRRYEGEAHLVEWVKQVSRRRIDDTLEYLMETLKTVPLAGSTVGFDRRWLREHMPKLEGLFSYRSIDVSSLTELARRWAPRVYESRPKAGKAHRALADVRESVAYLRYYLDAGFVRELPA